MVGKSERGPTAIEAIKDNKSAYLMAVGGAAYLVAKAIKSAKVVGFADLGMEAIYEFDVENMPVTVAVDSSGICGAQHRAEGMADQDRQDSGQRLIPDPDAESPSPRQPGAFSCLKIAVCRGRPAKNGKNHHWKINEDVPARHS